MNNRTSRAKKVERYRANKGIHNNIIEWDSKRCRQLSPQQLDALVCMGTNMGIHQIAVLYDDRFVNVVCCLLFMFVSSKNTLLGAKQTTARPSRWLSSGRARACGDKGQIRDCTRTKQHCHILHRIVLRVISLVHIGRPAFVEQHSGCTHKMQSASYERDVFSTY